MNFLNERPRPKPCIKSVGPTNANIALVGEAPGETEEQMGLPLVGASGRLIDEILEQAEIPRRECYITNVFFTRPPHNKLEAFCVKKADLPKGYSLPALTKGQYLHPDFIPEVDRLYAELKAVRPNLIVALGNTACWALLQQTAISKIRGTVVASPYGKVLPTYHPAAIFRQWDLRPILVADLIKANRERKFPDVRRPHREVWINPSLEDIAVFFNNWLKDAARIAVDIETRKGQITCIGFAPSRDRALVIPFVDDRKIDKSYWPMAREEFAAWRWVEKILKLPAAKIFQNGLYDIQYLRRMKLHINNAREDTMILHHALFPEMLKGLGFMGSVYTNEASWKIMRQRGEDNLKRDDE